METSLAYFQIEHFFSDTFSHIGAQILDYCRIQDILNCKLVSKKWLKFIENEQVSWVKEINYIKKKCTAFDDLMLMLNQLQTRGKGLDCVKAVAIAVRHLTCRVNRKTVLFERNFALATDFCQLMLTIDAKKLSQLIIDNHPLDSQRLEEAFKKLQIEAAELNQLDFYIVLAKITRTVNPVINSHGMTLLHNSPSRIKVWILEHDNGDLNLIRSKGGVTPLHTAASLYNKEPEPFKIMVSKVQEVNVYDYAGNTPLHCYIMMNNFHPESDPPIDEFIDILYNGPGENNPNQENFNGVTPLELAAEFGNYEAFKRIALHLGMDKISSFPFSKGMNALHYAAWHDNAEFVRFCLVYTDTNPHQVDEEGDTPLQIAADFELLNSFKCMLLYLGQVVLDPIIFPFGRNALHFAVQCDDTVLLQYLLHQFNVDPNQSDDIGTTPLQLAAQLGRYEAFKLIAYAVGPEKLETVKNPMHCAVLTDDKEFVKFVLNATNVNPNPSCRQGISALHLAACKMDGILFSIIAMKTSEDPLGLAAQHSHYAAFRLIAFQTFIDKLERFKFEKDRTALHLAALMKDTELIEYILSATKLDPNAVDDDGNTALHLAAIIGDLQGFNIIAKISDNHVLNLAGYPAYFYCPMNKANPSQWFENFSLEDKQKAVQWYDAGNKLTKINILDVTFYAPYSHKYPFSCACLFGDCWRVYFGSCILCKQKYAHGAEITDAQFTYNLQNLKLNQ